MPKLVACTGAFGGQTESVNLSLTAIGESQHACFCCCCKTSWLRACRIPLAISFLVVIQFRVLYFLHQFATEHHAALSGYFQYVFTDACATNSKCLRPWYDFSSAVLRLVFNVAVDAWYRSCVTVAYAVFNVTL